MSRAVFITGTIVLSVAVLAAIRFVPSVRAVHKAERRLALFVGRKTTQDELSTAFGAGGWRLSARKFDAEWPGGHELIKRHPDVGTALKNAAEVSIFSSNVVVCLAFSDQESQVQRVMCYEQ